MKTRPVTPRFLPPGHFMDINGGNTNNNNDACRLRRLFEDG